VQKIFFFLVTLVTAAAVLTPAEIKFAGIGAAALVCIAITLKSAWWLLRVIFTSCHAENLLEASSKITMTVITVAGAVGMYAVLKYSVTTLGIFAERADRVGELILLFLIVNFTALIFFLEMLSRDTTSAAIHQEYRQQKKAAKEGLKQAEKSFAAAAREMLQKKPSCNA